MAMFKNRGESSDANDPVENRREEPVLPAGPRSSAAASRPGECATVGPSIRIQGDMTGEEDLLVQGRIEGTVSLKNNLVTVGKDGHVNATVDARVIKIEGTVEGDLHGNEQVIVSRSGNVRGNIVAPRVTLEDGCRFKGSIDMDVADSGSTGKVTDLLAGASAAGESGKKS